MRNEAKGTNERVERCATRLKSTWRPRKGELLAHHDGRRLKLRSTQSGSGREPGYTFQCCDRLLKITFDSGIRMHAPFHFDPFSFHVVLLSFPPSDHSLVLYIYTLVLQLTISHSFRIPTHTLFRRLLPLFTPLFTSISIPANMYKFTVLAATFAAFASAYTTPVR